MWKIEGTMERYSKNEENAAENEPLIAEDEGGAIREEEISFRIRPKRTIIVEPLAVLYALAGMPLISLKSQYMYQKISWDLGINLNNLSGNWTNFEFLSAESCSIGTEIFNTNWPIKLLVSHILDLVKKVGMRQNIIGRFVYTNIIFLEQGLNDIFSSFSFQ